MLHRVPRFLSFFFLKKTVEEGHVPGGGPDFGAGSGFRTGDGLGMKRTETGHGHIIKVSLGKIFVCPSPVPNIQSHAPSPALCQAPCLALASVHLEGEGPQMTKGRSSYQMKGI